MKELKFNLRFLLRKKELYYAIIVILLINLLHVIFVVNDSSCLAETCRSGEYQFILNNHFVQFTPMVVLIFPIVCALIFSDTSWCDIKYGTGNLLYTRVNYKRNILVRFLINFLVSFLIVFIGVILNYVTLRFIFGSGNVVTHVQSTGFYLKTLPDRFLESTRLSNPQLYAVLLSGHISLIIALLVTISYSFSLFIKQRIFIYFLPVFIIIFFEFIFAFMGLSSLSFLQQLQPLTVFNYKDAFISYLLLFIISIFGIVKYFLQRDKML